MRPGESRIIATAPSSVDLQERRREGCSENGKMIIARCESTLYKTRVCVHVRTAIHDLCVPAGIKEPVDGTLI